MGPPGNIELGEAGGGSRVCARARAARAPRSIKPWKSNETLEELAKKQNLTEKRKKKGHRRKQGKKKGKKEGRAGRPDAVRTPGEKSIF